MTLYEMMLSESQENADYSEEVKNMRLKKF